MERIVTNNDKICKNLCPAQGGGPIYAKCATFPRHAGKGEPGLIADEAMEIVETKLLPRYYHNIVSTGYQNILSGYYREAPVVVLLGPHQPHQQAHQPQLQTQQQVFLQQIVVDAETDR